MQLPGDAIPHTEGAASWIERLLTAQRRKLFDAFVLFRRGSADETVLSVEICSADARPRSWSDAPGSLVTSSAIDPAQEGARLLWPDASFDWVFCGEVIEHAGSDARRHALVQECFRIARKGVFITTPNRGHLLDFGSGLPFVHWLTPAMQRRLCGVRKPLALLNASDLYALAEALPGRPEHDVGHKRVFGIKAHFFLMISKDA